jgi:PPOX class probable F420-dependent enzyme
MATLTDKQAQLLLAKNFGSLAVLRDDGAPEVTPVWVDWDGEYVLVNTLRSRAKPDRVRRDPRVEIAVTSGENPYQHVRISGTAEVVEEGAEEHIDKLAQKYLGKDTYPRNPGEQRVLLRFRPERVATYNLD